MTAPDFEIANEIERKYVLSELPLVCVGGSFNLIEQGWIPSDRIEERVRRTTLPNGTMQYWRSIKTGEGLVRIEATESITPELFAKLWPVTDRRVRKRRYVHATNGFRWEIDQFLDRQLVLMEVELPHASDNVGIPPELQRYVLEDVTGNEAYLNKNLARVT